MAIDGALLLAMAEKKNMDVETRIEAPVET